MALPQLYLELTQTQFFLAQLDNNKGTTTVVAHTLIELEPWVVDDDSVYGIKVLGDHLKHFLNTHGLTRPWTIVCATSCASADVTRHPFLLLQCCLIFCSAGIRIVGVYDTPLLEKELVMKPSRGAVSLERTARANLFSYFLPNLPESYLPWLAATVTAFGVATLLMFAITKTTLSDIAVLQGQQQNNYKITEDAKDQAHALHCLEDVNEELSGRLQAIKDLEATDVPNVPAVIRSLTVNISQRTWISQVKMSSQQSGVAGQQSDGHEVSITGHTPAHDEVTTLVRRLSRTTVMTSVNLKEMRQVQRATPSGMQPEYTFNVSGIVPSTTEVA